MLAPIIYTSSENKLYPSLPTLPTYGNIPLSGATKLSSGWTAFYLAVLTANIWLAKREFRQSFVPEFACEVFHAIQFDLQGRNGPILTSNIWLEFGPFHFRSGSALH